MEGTIWKWTNYLSGWQQRYFVLENDELRYYDDKNHKETDTGKFRASLNVGTTASEIDINGQHITISGMQRKTVFYLQIENEEERCTWLEKIGTARACALAIGYKPNFDQSVAIGQSEVNNNETGSKSIAVEKEEMGGFLNRTSKNISKSNNKPVSRPQTVKLSLTRNSTQDESFHSVQESPSHHKELILEQVQSVQVFLERYTQEIETIVPKQTERLLQNAQNQLVRLQMLHREYEIVLNTEQETQHTNTETNISNCGSNGTNVSVRERLEQENHNRQCDDDTLAGSTTSTANCNSQKKPSASLPSPPSSDCFETASVDNLQHISSELERISSKLTGHTTQFDTDFKNSNISLNNSHISESCQETYNTDENSQHQPQTNSKMVSASFFNTRTNTYAQVARTGDGGFVDVETFVKACTDFAEIYDLIGGKVFAPLKSDVMGNVEKVKNHALKLNITTLEGLVQNEVNNKTQKVSGSATDALVWLKRGLWLFCKFLLKIRNGERNPTAAFTEAYNETLSKHHNFVVRGMVKMMLNALPAQESLVNTLVHAHDSADGSKEKVLLAHITEYTNSMEPVLTQLDVFYVGQKLAN